MTANIEHVPQTNEAKGRLRRLLWVSPLAMLAASAVNLGLYAAAGQVFPQVTAWPGAGPAQIVGATVVYLLVGTLVFALVARFAKRPARTYSILATIGLLLSLFMPISAGFGYGAPGAPTPDAATVATLSLMHVAAYLISVPMFNRMVLD